MKVFITPTAHAELAEIADWIALGDPARAESFAIELLERAYGLADFPRAFPMLDAFEDRGDTTAGTPAISDPIPPDGRPR